MQNNTKHKWIIKKSDKKNILINSFFHKLQTLLVCLMALAIVSAVPVDEAAYGVGELYDQDTFNPQDPNSFFKLKKLKKLLFG